MENYWAPNEIRFSRGQVQWLLPYLYELRAGEYPINPHETGYVGSNHSFSYKASFETICLIAAELDIRLAACFPDGILVEEHFTKSLSASQIAEKYHRDTFTVERGIKNALTYISSGSVQRWHVDHRDFCTYAEWKGHYRREKEILAIIPAKGNSTRLPFKNILPLAGEPLICHTIRQAQSSKLLTKVVVSTDSDSVADIARNYGVEVLVHPHNGSLSVWQYVLNHFERQNYMPLLSVLLQVTSPLRRPEDIDATIKLAFKGDSAISVSGTKLPGIDYLSPVPEPENGAIYVSRSSLIHQGKIIGDRVKVYQMPASTSIDIDTEEDFKLAEKILAGVS